MPGALCGSGCANVACEPAGSLRKDGYVMVVFNRNYILAHRLIWFYVFGEWPVAEIDHTNGNRSDNRLSNLRQVTKSENVQNQHTPEDGMLGVDFNRARAKWRSRITVNGKVTCLGYFSTKKEAYAAYRRAKKVLHPKAARYA